MDLDSMTEDEKDDAIIYLRGREEYLEQTLENEREDRETERRSLIAQRDAVERKLTHARFAADQELGRQKREENERANALRVTKDAEAMELVRTVDLLRAQVRQDDAERQRMEKRRQELTDEVKELRAKSIAYDRMVEALGNDLVSAENEGQEYTQILRNLVKDYTRLQDEASMYEATVGSVYDERNRVVAALAALAMHLGWQAGVRQDEDGDPEWPVVLIDTPKGQVSWHVRRTQLQLFHFLPEYGKPWDGHTTEDKYERIAALSDMAKSPARPDRSQMMEYLAGRVLRLEMKITNLHAQHMPHAAFKNPDESLDEAARMIEFLKVQARKPFDPSAARGERTPWT